MTDQITPRQILYGIWIPGAGWLRIRRDTGESVPYAETNLEIADQVANNIGNGAYTQYIDSSIVTLQDQYLRHEKQSWRYKIWRTLTNWNRSNK